MSNGVTRRSIRMRELREAMACRIADQFEASGIEYTCGAVVTRFALPIIEAAFRDEPEYAAEKGGPALAVWKLQKAAWDEVHRRYMARKAASV